MGACHSAAAAPQSRTGSEHICHIAPILTEWNIERLLLVTTGTNWLRVKVLFGRAVPLMSLKDARKFR